MKLPVRQNTIRRNCAAMTLAEVLICMAIISVSMAGLMGSFQFAFFNMQLARENQRATQIILEKAEAIRCYRWDRLNQIPPSFTNWFDERGGNVAKGTEYKGFIFQSSFNPSGTAPSYAGTMATFTIVVNWKTGSVDHWRTNVTYVAANGIQNYVY